MKKLFLGKNAKNLVGRAATLLIIGLIIAPTFIVVLPSFAKNAQNFLNKRESANSDKRGSVKPDLEPDPVCEVFDDILEGDSSPFTLTIGGAPSCDRVDWIFPNIDDKTCTFKGDGNFDSSLRIDFYDSRDRESNDSPVTSKTVNSSGTFSVKGINIVRARLNTDNTALLADRTITLGNIKYTCKQQSVAPFKPFNSFTPFSSFPGSVSGSVGPGLNPDSKCPVNTDQLINNNPIFTLVVGEFANCNRVDWIFPDTDNKTCTFKGDGNFDSNLQIDFYSFRDGAPSDNPGSPRVTSATVVGGTFSASGFNIVHAHLNTDNVSAGETTLGRIKYTCR